MVNKKLPVTGALLVGGESKRMGKNKAFLKLGEKMLIERNLEVLDAVCKEVVISGRSPGTYERFGYPVIVDRIKEKGPLGGIYSILTEASYDYTFVLACDMPLANEASIRFLFGELQDYDAIVPKARNKLHPLYAFYHKRIKEKVEKNILNEKLKITQTLDECRTKIIEIDSDNESMSKVDFQAENLLNVNTPEEWQDLLGGIKKPYI